MYRMNRAIILWAVLVGVAGCEEAPVAATDAATGPCDRCDVSAPLPDVPTQDAPTPAVDVAVVDATALLDAPMDRPEPVDVVAPIDLPPMGIDRVDEALIARDAAAEDRAAEDVVDATDVSDVPDIACPQGASRCGTDTCRDLRTDPQHCGGCGRQCPADDRCIDGLCYWVTPWCMGVEGASCTRGICLCQGTCRDFRWDRSHCGGCGLACTSGEVCRDGLCGPVVRDAGMSPDV